VLMNKPLPGFWCECWTEDLSDTTGQPTLRASFDAYTVPQADRWVAIALRTITPALDPDASDASTVGLREVSRMVRDDDRLVPVLLPLGDGLLVALKPAG